MRRDGRPRQAVIGRLLLTALLVTGTLLPIQAGHALTSAPISTADQSRPDPVYPTSTDAPEPTGEPTPQRLDPEDFVPGNWIAEDGRVIPGIGILTESIDQAVYWDLRTQVDQRRLITVARQLPLDGRKLMLIVDRADEGDTPQQIRQDAQATTDAMVTERRKGMVLERLPVDTDQRPRLDPGWIVLTVMIPAASGTQGPVTVMELGEGVGLRSEGSVQRIEQAGHHLLHQDLLTDGLVELVSTAVEETTPPANTAWTSLTRGRWIILAGIVLLLAAIAGVPRLRQRRRARLVTAHQADPGWYGSAGGDPALRLRMLIETLALALDTPHARSLPSAQGALTTIVADTLELDRVAPRSRQGRPTPGWSSGSRDLESRVQAASQLLSRLIHEGADSRPRVAFPDDVRQVLQSAPGGPRGTNT